MDPLARLLSTAVGVGLLTAVACGTLTLVGAPERSAPARAILRGALQLGLVSLVLAGVVTSPGWVGLALAVMFVVAAFTAARRLRSVAWSTAVTSMGAGVLVSLGVVFSTGAIAFSPRSVLAIGGIVIGNTMAITALAGRSFLESIDQSWDQVEGWTALGATPRQATRELAPRALHNALIPTTDQTRTTGLVTLPGAFVGAVFGGASPLEAGRFQIVVLAAILCAGATAAAMQVRLTAAVRQRPAASLDSTSRRRRDV